jgi:hypothetical protein
MRIVINRLPNIVTAPRPLALYDRPKVEPVVREYKAFVPVVRKGEGCSGCPYKGIGVGNCLDWVGSDPKIAVMLEAPGETEIEEGVPLSGKAGQLWCHWLLESNGYTRENCVVCNTLRCRPKGVGKAKDKWNQYPTGKLRAQAEAYCRQYDDKLIAWGPDVFVATMHPAALLRTPAFVGLVQADMAKAFRLAERGYKPLVLMGDKAMGLCAPWLVGGVKAWRGHWWFGSLFRRYS